VIWRTSDWKIEKEITKTLEYSPEESFVRRLSYALACTSPTNLHCSWMRDGSHLVFSSATNNGANVGAILARGGSWSEFTFLVGHKSLVSCSVC
jgi:hypothetical protein